MIQSAGEFWDRESVQPTHNSWMADPAVRHYINALVSGRQAAWPLDWFQSAYPRRFRRALSIGCGTGPFERDLLRRGLCDSVDAFDGSIGSLAIAAREAGEAGFGGRVRYFAADFNEPAFPRRRYDLVIFHQSLHHVANVERLLRAVLKSLTPDGVLYLDEYVGPSRFDWNDVLLAPQRALYDALPAEARLFETLPLPIQADDPSEAFRSSDILPQLAVGFDVQQLRGYGGNVLSVLFPAIRWSSAPSGLVEELIDAERAMLAGGAPHFHAIVVARPKRGLAFVSANLRYVFERRIRAWRGQRAPWEVPL